MLQNTAGSVQSNALEMNNESRPDGDVIWAICTTQAMRENIELLRRSCLRAGMTVSLVVTCSDQKGSDESETPKSAIDIERFLTHWQPDLVIWFGDQIHVPLISILFEHGYPQLWIAIAGVLPKSLYLRRGKTKSVLDSFSRILIGDERARRQLVRKGAHPDSISVLGKMTETVHPIPYAEDERKNYAAWIGQRPVWLAADFDMSEIPMLAAANRRASRRSHRLLCIAAVPAHMPLSQVCNAFEMCGADTFQFHPGVGADLPSFPLYDTTQTLVVPGGAYLGLWYSLSSMTYWGGSLSQGATRHPYEAAVSGSALICGSNYGVYERAFRQLFEAEGCLAMQTSQDLSACIEKLLSANACASITHNAWGVATENTDTLSVVQRVVQDTLHQAP